MARLKKLDIGELEVGMVLEVTESIPKYYAVSHKVIVARVSVPFAFPNGGYSHRAITLIGVDGCELTWTENYIIDRVQEIL